MSWVPVTGRREVKELLRQGRVIAMRLVCLGNVDLDRILASLDGDPLTLEGAELADRVFELRIYDTNPCAVSVSEQRSGDHVGVYVWSGGGAPIESSGDPRVVELANKLDEWFGDGVVPGKCEAGKRVVPDAS